MPDQEALPPQSGPAAFDPAGIRAREYAPSLEAAVRAVQEAGQALAGQFSPDARVPTRETLLASIRAKEEVSGPILKRVLQAARPDAQWDEDEFDSGGLPEGAWWVTDPVEGNVNLIHGMPEWSVTAALVVDARVVLAAVHDPLGSTTYSALLGGGAFQDGRRLQASSKTDLGAALVGTGQAKPGEDAETHRRMTASIAAMLESALVLHVSVPATLQLVQVAAGRRDLFWQPSQVRSGLLAGGLLAAEAGCSVTDLSGQPWSLRSANFLACAPGLSEAAVQAFARGA